MMNYKYLYAFTSQEQSLVEIKRTDLPDSSPVGSVYHWLLIKDLKITKLTFKSMTKGEVEKREFAEGTLEFTADHANLNGHQLESFEPNDKIKNLITEFISGLDKV